MSAALELLAARAEFQKRAWPHDRYLAYVRENGLACASLSGPDPFTDAPLCVTMTRPLRNDRFEFAAADDDNAVLAAIVECRGPDRESVADFAAWPLSDPSRIRTMFGRCDMLGAWHVASAATYVFDAPLQAFKTPLSWLQNGCNGIVVLDNATAARRLLDAPGKISGESRQHAEELGAIIAGLLSRVQIVAPIDPLVSRKAA